MSAKTMMPIDTKRIDDRIKEEFIIPPPARRGGGKGKEEGDEEELVPISSLDPLGQLVFQGFKTLNRVQSKGISFFDILSSSLLS